MDLASIVSPMWRWRFLIPPPSEARVGERLACIVCLCCEFGTQIPISTAQAVLGNVRLRCEVWRKGSSTGRLAGQRNHASSARSNWRFNPLIQIEEVSDQEITVEVRVVGENLDGTPLTPLTVLDLVSAPIIIRAALDDPLLQQPCNPFFRSSALCERNFEFTPAITEDTHPIPRFQVSVREDFGDNLGAHVWNSSVVLSEWLCSSRASYLEALARAPRQETQSTKTQPVLSSGGSGATLELGSGCGVAGIVAAKLGASVTATDLARALNLLQLNVDANDVSSTSHKKTGNASSPVGGVTVATLDWRNPTAADLVGWGHFDLVIAADILYNPDLYAPLIALLNSSGASVALIALSHRNHGPAVTDATMREANTPLTHPFFTLAREFQRGKAVASLVGGSSVALSATTAAQANDPKMASNTCDNTSPVKNNLTAASWETRSVYFFANVEVLEMRKILV